MNISTSMGNVHQSVHPEASLPVELVRDQPIRSTTRTNEQIVEDELAGHADSDSTTELRSSFDDFVGQTFFAHLLKAMRKTVDKPAYFHGGRAEEVFQGQLDQLLVEQVSRATASTFTDPMFELFTMTRR